MAQAQSNTDFISRTLQSARKIQQKYGLSSSEVIPADMSFRDWCEELGKNGLKVDDHPFSLEDRKALEFIYDLIPTTKKKAKKLMLVVMKGSQLGLTIWEMLANLYMALKFSPCKIGAYVPDRSLAAYKSTERFLPVLKTVPIAYEKLISDPFDGDKKRGEGNVLTRNIGSSKVLFLWTSGKVSTESFPLDVLTFDEVQEMTIAQMEKTMERISASYIGFIMMLSTANWPDADIHYWYQRGNQYQFHTKCGCVGGVILDEHFPKCIQFNDGKYKYAPIDKYVYVCPVCNKYIPDSQNGEWIPKLEKPPIILDEIEVISIHMPQFLSATVGPGGIISSYNTASDMKNFYNRKLGKPYANPSQIPISLDIMNQCAKDGMAAGIIWKQSAKGTYMGIDQMGAYNVAIIKERLADGRQAVIHVEGIYSDDPFERCSEMMKQYGVVVCVVETLPNYNDAKRFANRHKGKVFLASYSDIKDDMLNWGDAKFTKADRKTDEQERDRYTVSLDQYKCMQTSMARFVKRQCVFPDPNALTQDVLVKGIKKKIAICKDEVFLHFTKTALVAEKDEEQKKYRRKVVKVGIDPHFSYANMLCDIAWARAHGTSHFILPEAEKVSDTREQAEKAMPGLDQNILKMMDTLPAGEVCGRCASFDPEKHYCTERNFGVRPKDPGCMFFIKGEDYNI